MIFLIITILVTTMVMGTVCLNALMKNAKKIDRGSVANVVFLIIFMPPLGWISTWLLIRDIIPEKVMVNGKEVRIIKDLPTIARVSIKTKTIEAHPRFVKLPIEIKTFVIVQLELICQGNSMFKADEIALDSVRQSYPKKSMGYWMKNFQELLSSTPLSRT